MSHDRRESCVLREVVGIQYAWDVSFSFSLSFPFFSLLAISIFHSWISHICYLFNRTAVPCLLHSCSVRFVVV
ncbi:hypothetical protein AG1IA_04873 [Rhizoctonia solani AG-1 IA]|uniref:Uncharacterized protein n=1 Tax=Thanatephorus cucumeris (strain AG1-IA) TaxID=983506 RepID=L8WW88_THACA|nr:hypothetical protein AG1IA_04873 [Rhizoctonia solani AG-1 IA]